MVWNKIKVFAEMIKFEHTIFALPFAYLGMFLGVRQIAGVVQGRPIPSLEQFIWITLAMVGARTAAMALNRLIDRHIDARNPRTATRALPQGHLSAGEVWVYIVLSFALLIVAAYHLQPLAVKLFPIAVFVLSIYSYMKRISWTCHLVLGLALGLAPLGAWLGITGTIDLAPVILGLAVALWVAGFDIIYACQDFEFDRKSGLHSIPARFGLVKALNIARFFHVLAVILLILSGGLLALSWVFFLGVVVAAGILYYEHMLVSPGDLSKLDAAFFNMNGILSVIVFLFTFADIMIFIG